MSLEIAALTRWDLLHLTARNSTMSNQSRVSRTSICAETMKVSAIAAAAAELAALMTTPAYAAGNETIKVALIGCGSRGAGAAAQALSTAGPVKLWAMADAFSDRLELCLKGVQREI